MRNQHARCIIAGQRCLHAEFPKQVWCWSIHAWSIVHESSSRIRKSIASFIVLRPRRSSRLKMAASAGSQIPVVDFSSMSLENADPLNENKEAVNIVADQLYRAFSTIGFVYLQNHGIPQEMVR